MRKYARHILTSAGLTIWYRSTMPLPRILLASGGCYHVISRIVERSYRYGPSEKEFFVATMRRLEAFLDVRVLTYCVMSNHFHLLVEVPEGADTVQLTPALLRDRLPLLYRKEALASALDELDRAMANAASPTGTNTWLDSIVARYQARMGDLSVFLKELKWRFSRWYNQTHDRAGTLWEDRYRSVLVEGDEHALMTIAAYIELNPVRAGLIGDPKDYRWSGYGEAVAGKQLARERLARLHGRVRSWQGTGQSPLTWKQVAEAYRVYLFGQGRERAGHGISGKGAKRGIRSEIVDKESGVVALHLQLRKKIDYFAMGVVLGSSAFINEVFEIHKDRLQRKRAPSFGPVMGSAGGDIASLRKPHPSASP